MGITIFHGWIFQNIQPLVIQYSYGTSPFSMGKSTIHGHFQELELDITRGYIYNPKQHLESPPAAVPPSLFFFVSPGALNPSSMVIMRLWILRRWESRPWRTSGPRGETIPGNLAALEKVPSKYIYIYKIMSWFYKLYHHGEIWIWWFSIVM